jgi:MFS family permease
MAVRQYPSFTRPFLVIKTPAFRNADFRRLWVGVACNHLGMSGEQVIVGLLVFRITNSTAWVGVALALYFLPLFIFGALSGVLADRLDRRILLRRIELCIVANLVLFAVLVSLGIAHLWAVLAFTAVAGSLRALHQPVRISYAYDIAGSRHVVGSLGLLSLGTRLGQLIGALLVGSMMQRIGTPGALLALVLVHLISFALFCRLRSVGIGEVVERVPMRQNLREFFAEMHGNRVLAMLVIVTAAVEVFGFSFATALPELATRRFDFGAEGLGLMQATRAVGGLLASLTFSMIREPKRHGAIYLVVIFAFGISLLLLSAADRFTVALAALILVAGMAAASDILTQSMMQLSVPNRLRGRAMGAWVLAVGFAPLGHLEMGVLSESLDVGKALFTNGMLLIGIGIITTIAVPRLRKI